MISNEDERMPLINPVKKKYSCVARPLPKHLRDEQLQTLSVKSPISEIEPIFTLMLRCGLRSGGCTTYGRCHRFPQPAALCVQRERQQSRCLSERWCSDCFRAYMKKRRLSKQKKVFLVQKGHWLECRYQFVESKKNRILRTEGWDKCMLSHLRHTMALSCWMPMPILPPSGSAGHSRLLQPSATAGF